MNPATTTAEQDRAMMQPGKNRGGLFLLSLGIAGLLHAGAAFAVSTTPPPPPEAGLSLKDRAARRFPQPITVATLGHRQVIEPSNHQGVLGYVAGVARTPDGDVKILLKYGGWIGWGTHLIAVPVEATGLLGQFLEVLDLDAAQLDALPAWKPTDGEPLADNETIRIGLTRN